MQLTDFSESSQIPPAKPEACKCEPLEAGVLCTT